MQINKTKILSISISVIVSTLLVAGVVSAVTTIGTNITTEGTVSTTVTTTTFPYASWLGAGTEARGINLAYTGTLASNSQVVGINSAVTTAGTGGVWAAGIYGSVTQGAIKNVNGYIAGAEFEVINSAANVSNWFPLVLNASNSGGDHGQNEAYIALHDYGSTPMNNLFYFAEDTVAAGGILKAKTAAEHPTHTLRILVGDTPYYIFLSTTQ
jgi:hypothetical protein